MIIRWISADMNLSVLNWAKVCGEAIVRISSLSRKTDV